MVPGRTKVVSISDDPPGAGGLTSAGAADRLASVGPNELPRPARPSLPRRIAGELLQPLVVLLLVAAVVSGVVLHELLDAVAIGAIVVLNAAVGLVEEGWATRALEALREMSAPMARVIRGGASTDATGAERGGGDDRRRMAGGSCRSGVWLLASAALVAAIVGAEALDLDDAATRTFALMVLVVAHLLYAVVLTSFPGRGWLPAAVLGGLALHLLAMVTPAGRSLLDLAALPPSAWLAAALLACTPVAVLAVTLRWG
jgi:hypothetical protein